MLKISVLAVLVVYAGTGECQQSETRDEKICFNADEYTDALIKTLSLTDEQASEVVNDVLHPVRGKSWHWTLDLAKKSYSAFKKACKLAKNGEDLYRFIKNRGWWRRGKRSVPENRLESMLDTDEDTVVTADMIATLSAYVEGNSFCSTRRHMAALPRVSLNVLLTPFMEYEDGN